MQPECNPDLISEDLIKNDIIEESIPLDIILIPSAFPWMRNQE
jgi:hypothetical protein